MIIDIEDNITPHFTWKEALFCPQWGVYVFPTDEEHMTNIIAVAQKLEMIREILKSPLRITSWYRPDVYNKLIGGAEKSAHRVGQAVDFQPTKVSVMKSKIALKDFLEDLDLRMEDNGRGNWIHIDTRPPGRSGRFFKP